MLVDDDRTTAGLLRTLLELDGFEVILAPSGEAALAGAEATKPDAFVVDVRLPDSSGTDFVRQLRADVRFADAPIVMTSGLDSSEDALAAGANKFLIKPFEPSQLIAALQELLGAA